MNTRNLELWLGLASVPVECAGCGQYGWVQMDCPPQWVTNEFGSLGTLQTMFVFGNSTWRYVVWSVAWFPHVLYRLWPIGVAARRSEIPNRRCRRLLTWLWPCARTGTRFSDILHYAWWWPCGGKVTSLPRGVSMYMVVAMWWEWSIRREICKDIIYGCGHVV